MVPQATAYTLHTVVAFPAVLGYVLYGRFEAECVETTVALVAAHDIFPILFALAHFADAAGWAAPCVTLLLRYLTNARVHSAVGMKAVAAISAVEDLLLCR